MDGPNDSPAPGGAPAPALPFVLAIGLALPLGLLAQAASPALGLLATELVVFLALPALVARSLGRPVARSLGLVAAPPRTLLLGALAGAVAIPLGGGLMGLAALALPEELVRRLDVARIFNGAPWEVWLLSITAALVAPLCEEAAFRGAVLRGLAATRPPARAIGLSALLFAAVHLDPVRFPALLALGLLFGWLALRGGSILPAVAAHAVNNAAALAAALAPGGADGPLPGAGEALLQLAVGLLLLLPVARAYARATPPAPPALSGGPPASPPPAAPPAPAPP